jgi:hypothetical protein
MLKRTQVLLNDWIVDHVKATSKKYDISFSEVVRLLISIQAALHIQMAYPEYNCKINLSQMADLIKRQNEKKDLDPEDLHKFISQIYFEARKAMEYWANEESKKQKRTVKKAKAG